MYTFIGLVILAIGAFPLVKTLIGMNKNNLDERIPLVRKKVSILLAVIAFLVIINQFFYYYTEYYWFNSLGFSSRFWIEVFWIFVFFFSGILISFLFIFGNVWFTVSRLMPDYNKSIPFFIAVPVAVIYGLLVGALWDSFLLFARQHPTELADPVFNAATGFYLFTLPFLSSVQGLLSFLVVIAVASCFFILFMPGFRQSGGDSTMNVQERLGKTYRQLFILLALFFALLAWDAWLEIFGLMYSKTGAVVGVGYTQLHVTRIGYYAVMAVYSALALMFIAGAVSERVYRLIMGPLAAGDGFEGIPKRIYFTAGGLVLAVFLVLVGIPGFVQNIVVSPNEITLEKPFLRHNIEFTRRAYGIHGDRISTRKYVVEDSITRAVVGQNRGTLDNVRLWDWRALMDNLREQQEIRLYYEFNDVDIDRYHIDGRYTQVMLSVRELEKSNLAVQSQTWVSRHIKYTHGYGMVLLPAHEFLEDGRPDLYLRDIPPRTEYKSLEVTRPEIYYGERTDDHVYVNTKEKEFDYPLGDQNRYTSYDGSGGVRIDSLVKRVIYSWRYDSYRLLFSSYITRESRILFRRDIMARLNRVAPFLRFDRDPYAVLTGDSSLVYIVDAYTVSDRYPYSEEYRGKVRHLNGINYIRNSVKAVVDAYNGTVRLYIYDESDPVIRTYRNIYPELFKKKEDMPADIRKHVRYPVDFFQAQAEMYSTYHMEDFTVFYQREDVWEFATERYRENFQFVEPYYIMINFPESGKHEYVLIMPFTPKNKNVSNAWMAGRCDYPEYGNIDVFTFPKGVEVLGPRQIEARIDQDTEMSRAMTLWGQRGSSVIRGNLLAIPLFFNDTLRILYVEPIFIQAEDARLPEIKRVVVADQDRVYWGESFDGAMSKLLSGRAVAGGEDQVAESIQSMAREATGEFKLFQEYRGKQEFIKAEKHFENLKDLLNRMTKRIE